MSDRVALKIKFGEYIDVESVPEWRERYIDYQEMKDMANAFRNIKHLSNPANHIRFFIRCDAELTKVNRFFDRKIREINRKWSELAEWAYPEKSSAGSADRSGKSQKSVEKSGRGGGSARDIGKSEKSETKSDGGGCLRLRSTHQQGANLLPHLTPQEAETMRTATSEFYWELKCLKNFQTQNLEAFEKIIHKYERACKNGRGENWLNTNVITAPFAVMNVPGEMMAQVMELRVQLEGGDRGKAWEKLRVPSLKERQRPNVVICGIVLWSLFWIIVAAILICGFMASEWWQPPWIVVRLYRMPFQICLHTAVVALNMHIWRRGGVNYVLAFELDPRKHLTGRDVSSIASLGSLLWAISLLGFITSEWMGVSRFWFPLILIIIYIVLIVNPFGWYRSSRYWLLRRLFNCAIAPLHNGSFRDFWFACQLTSLARLFQDVEYFVCFYATELQYANGSMYLKVTNATAARELGINDFVFDPLGYGMDPLNGRDFCSSDSMGIRAIFRAIPYYVRVSQNFRRYSRTKQFFPHFVNGVKYATSFPEIIFETLYRTWMWPSFFHLWMISSVIRYTFSLVWDIRMDWKLFNGKPGDRLLLRKRLTYKHPWKYYAALVFECITRCVWAIRATIRVRLGPLMGEHVSTGAAIIEIFRRFVWNIFRVETENMKNVDELRVTRNVKGIPSKKVGNFGKKPESKKVIIT